MDGLMGMSLPRLLSPVKSYEGAVRVIRAGADEVYCGVTIPGIKSFWLYRGPDCEIATYNELGQVVKYAHDHDVNVVVTINRPFMTKTIEEDVKGHILSCLDQGVDAFMIGDVGILSMMQDLGVDKPLYASTYMVSTNWEDVEFLRELGFSRVVLERHLTITEISEIVRRSRVEVEVFIHGAGCSNTNGNCYLFHYNYPPLVQAEKMLTGFSNPCVLPFEVYDVNDRKTMIDKVPILDAFTFCSTCQLPELIKAGVSGFKIVGRGVHIAFQESATKMYRELIDLIGRGKMELFWKKIEFLRRNFIGIPPWLVNLREVSCEQKRCYYYPLFHAPYKTPLSWQAWTKLQFESVMFVG